MKIDGSTISTGNCIRLPVQEKGASGEGNVDCLIISLS